MHAHVARGRRADEPASNPHVHEAPPRPPSGVSTSWIHLRIQTSHAAATLWIARPPSAEPRLAPPLLEAVEMGELAGQEGEQALHLERVVVHPALTLGHALLERAQPARERGEVLGLRLGLGLELGLGLGLGLG